MKVTVQTYHFPSSPVDLRMTQLQPPQALAVEPGGHPCTGLAGVFLGKSQNKWP
jgi:hypothetical protein